MAGDSGAVMTIDQGYLFPSEDEILFAGHFAALQV